MFSAIRRILDPQRRSRPRASRPRLEALEPRLALSLGSEFHIATTTQLEGAPATAGSPNGMSVVVWEQISGTKSILEFQLYNAAGNRIGNPTLVAGNTNYDINPSVTMDGQGNFVVAWQRRYSTSSGYDWNVLAARFNSAGWKLGGNVWVATDPTKNEVAPSVAADLNGNFVVSYTRQYSPTDTDIMAKMFTSNGISTGLIPVANTLKNEPQSRVARGPLGRFSVAYVLDYSSTDKDVYLKRYTAAGNLEATYSIATSTDEEGAPSVSMDNNGNAVVAWHAKVGGTYDVFARRVSGTGVMGPRITIHNAPINEGYPSVALNRTNGSFMVTYAVSNGTDNWVYVNQVSPTNTVMTTYNLGPKRLVPSIAVANTGRYLVDYEYVYGTSDLDIYGRFGTMS